MSSPNGGVAESPPSPDSSDPFGDAAPASDPFVEEEVGEEQDTAERARQVMKTWIDAVGRWLNGNPDGIDSYHDSFGGGEDVIDAARELINTLDKWRKQVK